MESPFAVARATTRIRATAWETNTHADMSKIETPVIREIFQTLYEFVACIPTTTASETIKGITNDIQMTIPGLLEVMLLGYLKDEQCLCSDPRLKCPSLYRRSEGKTNVRSHRRSYCTQLRCYKDVPWEISQLPTQSQQQLTTNKPVGRGV